MSVTRKEAEGTSVTAEKRRSGDRKKGCPLKPGKSYSFLFPRHNFHGVVSRSERRRVRIESVRDLKEQPIDNITFNIQPLLRRGRYLATGLDLDINEERSFYVKSMRDIVELDPELSERQPVTVWIVGDQPYRTHEQAEAAAQAQALESGRQVIVEKAVIPVDLKRTLETVIDAGRVSA